MVARNPHSISGTTFLKIIGIIYALASVCLLVWHGWQTWGASLFSEASVRIILICSLLASIWLIREASSIRGRPPRHFA